MSVALYVIVAFNYITVGKIITANTFLIRVKLNVE